MARTRPASWLRMALLASLLLTVAVAGCTSGGKEAEVPPQDDQGRYVIRMTEDLRFEPERARVPAGSVVVWVNDTGAGHDVNGHPGHPDEADFPDFSSRDVFPPYGLVPPGGEFTYNATAAGVWTVWCHTHHEADMQSLLFVE